MPLYKTITTRNEGQVLIWKIEESYEELAAGVELTDFCQNRVDRMKSDLHRRGFMSVRHLLAQAGLSDADLEYSSTGKPHLKSETRFISISHSYEFSTVIIGERPVGIDVEKQRSKILRIAHKFTDLKEYYSLSNEDGLIRKLSVIWGAKESLYKLHGVPGLLFLKHIHIDDFDFESRLINAQVYVNGEKYIHQLQFLEFEGFTAVFTLS